MLRKTAYTPPQWAMRIVHRRRPAHAAAESIRCQEEEGDALFCQVTVDMQWFHPVCYGVTYCKQQRNLSESGRRHGVDWGGHVHPTFARGHS